MIGLTEGPVAENLSEYLFRWRNLIPLSDDVSRTWYRCRIAVSKRPTKAKNDRSAEYRCEAALSAMRNRAGPSRPFYLLILGFLPIQARSLSFLHIQQDVQLSDFATRRHFLSASSTIWTSIAAAAVITPSPAIAAAPITIGESENVGSQLLRLIRPKPPRILRTKLNQDFAVLLMRSSYNVLDQLDCVAMDQFQRDFFIIRQGSELSMFACSTLSLAMPYDIFYSQKSCGLCNLLVH